MSVVRNMLIQSQDKSLFFAHLEERDELQLLKMDWRERWGGGGGVTFRFSGTRDVGSFSEDRKL